MRPSKHSQLSLKTLGMQHILGCGPRDSKGHFTDVTKEEKVSATKVLVIVQADCLLHATVFPVHHIFCKTQLHETNYYLQ